MNVRLSQIRVTLPDGRKLFHIPSFELASGEQILLEGPSGIGKTTLLHLIAGLFRPTEGYVFVDEKNLNFLSDTQKSKLRRQNFGLLFQMLNLLDHLTALENVLLAMPPSREAKQKARDALSKVGMETAADRLTAHLSLGEQQRVAAARLLAAQPKIILADEPTSSLDDRNASAVLKSILEIEKATLILVSHDHRIRPHFKRVMSFEEFTAK